MRTSGGASGELKAGSGRLASGTATARRAMLWHGHEQQQVGPVRLQPKHNNQNPPASELQQASKAVATLRSGACRWCSHAAFKLPLCTAGKAWSG